MLLKLVVKNFAIIEDITLEFENNLSVITGETGAGKSILLGALELILGKRANHSVILNKEMKCIVEATFGVQRNSKINELLTAQDIEIYADLIIRREISPSGRSRAFLNDTPVNLDNLQEVGGQLVDMHRQFDNYELLQPKEQLMLLDNYLQLNEERANYQNNFSQYKKLRVQLEEKKLAIKTAKAEQDYLEFVWNEIESLHLGSNEIEDWNKQLDLLENAQSIKETLSNASEILNHNEQSIISALQNLAKETKQYSELSKQIESINTRLVSTIEELKDISAEIEIQEDSINTNEEQLVILRERLELGNNLLHKHNAQSTQELIEIKNQFQNKLEGISSASSDIQELENTLLQNEIKRKDQAEKLSKKRIKGLKKFKAEINKMLPDLGFLNATFDIQHSFTAINADGIDTIQFLFDANNIGKLKELKQSVSGGEMSRIMLAIKSLLAHSTEMPCMIFDEIDTGISGETAIRIGKVLQELSRKHQVISITHLPQIAAQAKYHLYVYKELVNEKQLTMVKSLQAKERLQVLAKMLSGKEDSESALLAAKELMQN